MKLVQIASGHHGVRQLVAARAEAALRKLGHLPPIKDGHGSGRPWTDEEYDAALAMRLRDIPLDEIAASLGRSLHSIKRVLA